MPVASVDLSSEVWAHQQEVSLPSNILGGESALSGKTGVSRRQLYRGAFDRSSESDVDSGTNLFRVSFVSPAYRWRYIYFLCVVAGWRVGLTWGLAIGVLGGVGVNSSNSPGSAHGREFPGPPNSFFSRNRKNKYISIFSTVSRDSTRDTIRRGRTHGSQSDDTPSPPGGGSAAFGGEAASRPKGAGVFSAAAAAYAASAGLKIDRQPSDSDMALAEELRRRLQHTSGSVPSPPHSPMETMLNVPGRHFFTTQGFEMRESGDAASSTLPQRPYTDDTSNLAAPSSTLSQSTTRQTAHSPLGYSSHHFPSTVREP